MKKGDILELNVDKFAFEGKGISKIKLEEEEKDNFVIFVDGAYPQDVVKAKIYKLKKNYAEAKTVEIVHPSQFRVDARCKYFGVCGGCKQQDLDYNKQVEFKQIQVEEIFTKMGGLKDFLIEPIIPSDKSFYYRNKMEFSFAERRWLTNAQISSKEVFDRDFALGLHPPNSFDKVLHVDECFLQSVLSNNILNLTRDFFKSRNTSIYTTKTHSGYLRNLVIKQSQHTKDLMVNIVTWEENEILINDYKTRLLNEIPEVTSIVNNISKKKAMISLGDYEILFHGSAYIYDSIGNYNFRISSNSFFQTNTLQAEQLYKTALNYAGLNGDEIVYDLYCGAGTISIFMSKNAKNIFGFEVIDSALEDAEANKELNKINNVQFYKVDLYKSFLYFLEENKIPKADVVILDPPRSGLHINIVNDVIAINPKRIVYVSCNPTTQVRDIKFFIDAGYKLIKIRPVDMFPHTYHIENVACLIKE